MADQKDAKPNTPQAASTPSEHAPVTPVYVAAITPGPAETKNTEDIQSGSNSQIEPPKRWYKKPDWWLTILNVLLVFVGAVTIWVFVYQLKEMQKQTKLISDQAADAAHDSMVARRESRRQIRIADEQAQAAQDSVVVLRQQFQEDQRPYVGITREILFDSNNQPTAAPTKGMPVFVNIYFKNVGKSPALNLRTHRHLVFGNDPTKVHVEPADKVKAGTILDNDGSEQFVTAVSSKTPMQ